MRILLVDDNPLFLRLVTLLLCDRHGLELVGQACAGDEALAQVARLRPDVVLMDYAMPVMNGLEATRQLKAQPDAPRIIILTLHDSPQYRAAAAAAGADGFIAKAECGLCLIPTLTALLCAES